MAKGAKTVTVRVERDHLERLATAGKPILGVAELIWNGFDADATEVRVVLDHNRLGGLETIRVVDNGHGMDPAMAEQMFENLGGSWKRNKRRSPSGRVLHGDAGEGRFKAFSLGERVTWASCFGKGKAAVASSVVGSRSNLGQFSLRSRAARPTEKPGTEVTIDNLLRDFTSLKAEGAGQDLGELFALYLRDYPGTSIWYDGVAVDPASAMSRQDSYKLEAIQIASGTMIEPELEIIEWKQPVGRSLVLCDAKGTFLSKLSAGIQAPGFNFTAYIKHDHLRELARSNSLELEELHPDVRKIVDGAKSTLRDHFRRRTADEAAGVVDSWRREDVYPYRDPPRNVVEEAERQVFDVLALNVNSYLPDFDKADPRSKRLSLRLIRQALEESPQALQRILREVLDLPKEKQEEFAELLERTTLAAMISASRVVSDRLDFLRGLEVLLFEAKPREELLERQQLQEILKDHTWVFGEEYHLTVSDQSLDEVLAKHMEELGKEADVGPERVRRTDGTIGRIDMMLSRRVPRPRAEERQHLVVELKRPSRSISLSATTQIQSYAFAVADDDRFRDTQTEWTFWAVSTSIDADARRQSRQQGRAEGILYADSERRITIWVKTWGELIDQSRALLEFFQKQLESSVNRDTAVAFLRRTHEKYLPPSLRSSGNTSPANPGDSDDAVVDS